MKLQSNILNIIKLWLLIAIPFDTTKNDDYYLAEQDTLFPNFETVINHQELNNYLADPDTLNLQLIYGWGRDLGLKQPRVGHWIADTLLSLAKQQNDHRAIISAYSLKAQMDHQQANYYNAIQSYKRAIRYGEDNIDYNSHPNFDKLGINYVYLGDLYYDMDDLKNARVFFKKGWYILSKITDKMIAEQDTINNQLYRDYTTYNWDRLYSKLKLGLIYTQSDNKLSDNKLDSGIALLKEVYSANDDRDAQLKIKAAYYLGRLFPEISSDSSLSRLLIEVYEKSKYSKLYKLQAGIGLHILKTQYNINPNDFDLNLAGEVIEALTQVENYKIKYQLFELLSNYNINKDIEKSKLYLDSAYFYRERFIDSENQKKIGKIQSDIQYESDLNLSHFEKEQAETDLYLALLIVLIAVIFIIVLVYLYNQRKRLLDELKEKNDTISSQNLRLVELIEAREKLIGILGHDLRNPIKGFRLSASNLKANSKSKELDQTLAEMESSAIEVENLLNSILDYAESNLNVSSTEIEEINLTEVIDSIITLNKNLVNDKSLHMNTNLEFTDVNSNRFILINALTNIITNAVKFSYEGKSVDISTYTEDNFKIIKIKDSGVGIDAENLKKIRNQIKPKAKPGIKAPVGNGFGLITSISQLEKANVNLFIETEYGVGTAVLIYINS